MNEENKRLILKCIRESSEKLKGRLPPSDKHPTGRNPYAHIPKVVKSVLGKSYIDLSDDHLEAVLEIIKYCEENPF